MLDLTRLAECIERSGKTRKYLCAKLGKPQYYLTNVFRRRIPEGAVEYDLMEPELLAILAEELGTTVAYLCGESEESRPLRASATSAYAESTAYAESEESRLRRASATSAESHPISGRYTKQRGVKIPVYGQVAAGIPIDAITDIEDYEDIPESMAATGDYAALRIHGDSMEPRMCDGDVVIVRLQDTADTGDTAIVIINGDTATCKKIKKTPEGVMLISTNPKYEPLFYSNADIETLPVRIWGKVVELRCKL